MARIVVLGGGESGCGSAVLAKVKGFDVFLSDRGAIAPKYRGQLEEWRVSYEEGRHTEELIFDADEVVKSPGIPESAPIVKALRERGIPVVSEIEFAGRYTDGSRTICITGSNGKTTTTTLAYEMLRQADLSVGLAGNIGQSFALEVATEYFDWYVIELSSFQLDGMYDFRADVGVLMNITPDHLDHYDHKLQNYVDSKFRILQNQRATDKFVYCADDPLTLENLGRHDRNMEVLPFGVKCTEGCAASLDGDTIRVRVDGRELSIGVDELKIKGVHNIYNAMAASIAALSAGVPPESICQTLRTFTGVEHRLEPCGEYGGVQYINDSKATNVDSVWYALDSMRRPTVWIAGGNGQGQRLLAALPARRRPGQDIGLHGCGQCEADARVRGTHTGDRRHAFAWRSDGGCGAERCSGGYGVVISGLCEFRPVQKLRAARRTVQSLGGETCRREKGPVRRFGPVVRRVPEACGFERPVHGGAGSRPVR